MQPVCLYCQDAKPDIILWRHQPFQASSNFKIFLNPRNWSDLNIIFTHSLLGLLRPLCWKHCLTLVPKQIHPSKSSILLTIVLISLIWSYFGRHKSSQASTRLTGQAGPESLKQFLALIQTLSWDRFQVLLMWWVLRRQPSAVSDISI